MNFSSTSSFQNEQKNESQSEQSQGEVTGKGDSLDLNAVLEEKKGIERWLVWVEKTSQEHPQGDLSKKNSTLRERFRKELETCWSQEQQTTRCMSWNWFKDEAFHALCEFGHLWGIDEWLTSEAFKDADAKRKTTNEVELKEARGDAFEMDRPTLWQCSVGMERACQFKQFKVAQYLMGSERLDPKNKEVRQGRGGVGWPKLDMALIYFSLNGSLEGVRLCLEDPVIKKRHEISFKKNGYRAYILAVRLGHIDIVKYFHETQALPLEIKREGLMNVISIGNKTEKLEMVQFFLERGWMGSDERRKYLQKDQTPHPRAWAFNQTSHDGCKESQECVSQKKEYSERWVRDWCKKDLFNFRYWGGHEDATVGDYQIRNGLWWQACEQSDLDLIKAIAQWWEDLVPQKETWKRIHESGIKDEKSPSSPSGQKEADPNNVNNVRKDVVLEALKGWLPATKKGLEVASIYHHLDVIKWLSQSEWMKERGLLYTQKQCRALIKASAHGHGMEAMEFWDKDPGLQDFQRPDKQDKTMACTEILAQFGAESCRQELKNWIEEGWIDEDLLGQIMGSRPRPWNDRNRFFLTDLQAWKAKQEKDFLMDEIKNAKIKNPNPEGEEKGVQEPESKPRERRFKL